MTMQTEPVNDGLITTDASPPGATSSKAIEWILWEHKTGKQIKSELQWKARTSEVAHFYSPADSHFHCDVHHLPLPSERFSHDTRHDRREFSLFRKGIEPEWESPENAGSWYCRQYMNLDELNAYWRNLVQAVVDQDSPLDHEHITGVRVDDKSRNRPMFQLEVWLNTQDKSVKERVKQQILQVSMKGATHWKHPIRLEWRDFGVVDEAVSVDATAD